MGNRRLRRASGWGRGMLAVSIAVSLMACGDDSVDGSSNDDRGSSSSTGAPGTDTGSTGDVPLTTTAEDSGGGDSSGETTSIDSDTGSTSGPPAGSTEEGGGDSSSSSEGGPDRIRCPDQIIDTVPGTYTDTVLGQGDEFGGSCGGNGAEDHALVLEAPMDGNYVFDTFGSNFDSVLYVLDGACGGPEISCNDDAAEVLQSQVSAQLTEGQTVTVVVDSYEAEGGDYTLNVSFSPGACPDSDLGSTVPQTISGDTTTGDNTVTGSCGGGAANDDAYSFTAPNNGIFTFDTAGSSIDTVLYLRDGDCNGPELACNDDVGGGLTTSVVSLAMTAGQSVVAVVDGNTEDGPYTLNISEQQCPNDDLGNTVPQTVTASSLGLPNVIDSSCSSSSGSGPDYAYTFTAPADATYIFDTFGSTFDSTLAVLDGADCTGFELACDDDTDGSQSQVVIDLVADQEVIILVDGYNDDDFGPFTLNVSSLSGACPDFDLGNTVPQSVAGDTALGDNASAGSCGGLGGNDDSWTFTAPSDGVFVFDTIGSSVDTLLYVLADQCGGAELACDDDGGGGTDSSALIPMNLGDEVVVVVDSDTGGGAYVLNVAEDVCPDADIGNAVPHVETGSNVGETDTLAGSCGGSGGADLAFAWTAPADGSYTFDSFGSTYDTVLYVLDGDCEGTELACDDDTSGTQSQVVVDLVADQTVTVVLDGFSSFSTGDYVLNITQ